MNIILFILFSTIVSAVSMKPKFCIDCKYFKNGISTSDKFGKCSLFPKVDTDPYDTYFLIDGKREPKKIEYTYCSTSRKYDDMCGIEGKFYEKKNKRLFL